MFSFKISKPVMSEGHIGTDKEIKNFAIAVVERVIGHSPVIVHCRNHTDLQLKNCFKATDVLCALKQHTNLLLWINPAYGDKAASLFNAPTIHSMFSWSLSEHRSVLSVMKPESKKVQDFRIAHEYMELFVIEEALAILPAYFALMDEMMTAAFNPKHRVVTNGELPPFSGKKCCFLVIRHSYHLSEDQQYEGNDTADNSLLKRESKQSKRTKTGQLIFQKHLVPNCVYLNQGQRNTGLLEEICDCMTDDMLTEDDCVKLTYQRARFPEVFTDYGIHYQNEMCSMYNWRQLWNE